MLQGVPKRPQHLIEWYLSEDIYAILSVGWYCRIGNAILHNYVKFHYQNHSGYFKIQLILTLLKNRFAQVLVEVR